MKISYFAESDELEIEFLHGVEMPEKDRRNYFDLVGQDFIEGYQEASLFQKKKGQQWKLHNFRCDFDKEFRVNKIYIQSASTIVHLPNLLLVNMPTKVTTIP